MFPAQPHGILNKAPTTAVDATPMDGVEAPVARSTLNLPLRAPHIHKPRLAVWPSLPHSFWRNAPDSHSQERRRGAVVVFGLALRRRRAGLVGRRRRRRAAGAAAATTRAYRPGGEM